MENAILQRRPLPKLAVQTEPCNSLKSQNRRLNNDHKSSNSEENDALYRLHYGKERNEAVYHVKPNGPSPFPWRNPKKLPNLFTKKGNAFDTLECFSVFSSEFFDPAGQFISDEDQQSFKTLDELKDVTNYPEFYNKIDRSNCSVHIQNLSETNLIPAVTRFRKPWRQALLEKQQHDVLIKDKEEMGDKKNSDEKQSLIIGSFIKDANMPRTGTSRAEYDGNLPEVCSFRINKPVVKLTDKQLSSLSKFHSDDDVESSCHEELDCIINESNRFIINQDATKLNLKGLFLDSLPIVPVSSFSTLTYMNLSYNEFVTVPEQLFLLHNLLSLNMRNNSISKIPKHLKQLKKLKYLNFSFCKLTKISKNLLHLIDLEVLDLSYNLILEVPKELIKLVALKELSLDGNMISFFPASIIHLNLEFLRCNNNFTHRLFWEENCPAIPQKLLDIAMMTLVKNNLTNHVPEHLITNLMKGYHCAYCGGVVIGYGVHVLKPVFEIFDTKNLPLHFIVCSQSCRTKLQFSKKIPALIQ